MREIPSIALADLGPPTRSITYGIVQPGKPADGGVPIVRVNNFRGHRLDLTERLCVALDVEAQYSRSRPRPNDILISLVGSIGQVAIAGPEISGWNLARAVGLIPTKDRHHALWIFYALQSPDAQRYIRQHANTTVQATFNLKDLTRFPIPYPEFQEREQIIRVLGSLDDKIELNRRMNETLEAMAQAIFRDWFVDFGPTRRKLEGATDPLTIMGGLVQDAERAQALADLFPAALGDDGLPDGWTETELGTLAVLLKRGLTPSYCDGGVPVINQKCIRNGQVNFAVARHHDSVKRPPKERALQDEDVLVNSTGVGTLGRVATVRGLKEEATADSHVTICRADADRISKLVFSLFLEGQQSLIETMGHGSTGQTELSPASLAALKIPVAPSQIQKAFDAIAAPLRSKATANAEQSLTLAATRDLLLPKLMSGEIRLSEAEGLMEAAQ